MNDQQSVNIHFEEPVAAPPADTTPRTPHTDWNQIIEGYREVLIKARAARTGQSPVTDPIPGVTMELGTVGEHFMSIHRGSGLHGNPLNRRGRLLSADRRDAKRQGDSNNEILGC